MTSMGDITTVVLAGGLGTRLREITGDRWPKPMVPVPAAGDHIPFVEFVLGHLYLQGVRDVVLCIGHLGAQIMDHFGDGSQFGLKIRYDDAGDADTGKRVLSAARLVPGSDFLVTCGDVYLPFDLKAFWRNFAKRNHWQCQIAVVDPQKGVAPNVVMAPDGQILAHGNGHDQTGRAGFEVGTLALRKSAFSGFSTAHDFSLTEDLFPRLIARQEIGGVLVDAPFFDIGTPARYHQFCDFAEANDTKPLSTIPVGGVS